MKILDAAVKKQADRLITSNTSRDNKNNDEIEIRESQEDIEQLFEKAVNGETCDQKDATQQLIDAHKKLSRKTLPPVKL